MAPVPSSTAIIMEVPILIKNLRWEAEAAGTILWEGLLPDIIAPIKAPMKGPLSTNAYWISDFILKVVINSTPFNVGLLSFVEFPFDKNYEHRTFAHYLNNPHVKLDAANSTTGELRIPFAHYLNFMSTNSTFVHNTFSRVALVVMQPLEVASGAATFVDVNIFLSPTEPETFVPIAQHEPIFSAASYFSNHSEIKQQLEDDHARHRAIQPIHLRSKIIDALDSISEDFPEPAKTVYMLGKHIFGDGEHDYPTDPSQPNLQTPRGAQSLAHGSGMDPSEVLDLRGTNEFTYTQAQSGMMEPQHDITKLVRRPGYVSNVQYSSSQLNGHVLFNWLVSPLLCYASFETDEYHATPTPLAYFSSLYRQWRGSIIFHLHFVGASSMSGRVLLAWIPNDFSPTALSVTDAANYPSLVIDLQGEEKHWSFAVPYATYTSFKLVNDNKPYGLYSPVYPTQLRSPTGVNCYNGRLAMYVLTSLSHPSNTSDHGFFYIYTSGGPDFTLRSLVSSGPLITLEDEPTPIRLKSKRNDFKIVNGTNSLWDVAESHDPINGYQLTITEQVQGNADTPALMNGEGTVSEEEQEIAILADEVNLNYLCKRYYCLGRQLIPPGNLVNLRRAVTPMQTTIYDSTDDYNVLDYVCRPFVFWSGSMKFSLVVNSNMTISNWAWMLHNVDSDVIPPVRVKNDAPFATVDGATVANLAMYHQQVPFSRASNFSSTCPYKTHYDRLLIEPPTFPYDTDAVTSGCIDFGVADSVAGQKFLSYYGGGDNFQLFFFVAPPYKKFSVV